MDWRIRASNEEFEEDDEIEVDDIDYESEDFERERGHATRMNNILRALVQLFLMCNEWRKW